MQDLLAARAQMGISLAFHIEDFRVRAIAGAIGAGVMAGVVLLLSIDGAPRICRGLAHRIWTWPLFWITAVLGLTALYALWTRRYQLSRLRGG